MKATTEIKSAGPAPGLPAAPVDAHVSPSLWALAWRRLKADTVAMIALVVVCFYLALLVLSMTGMIAKDWDAEVAVNYAPPTFVGPQSAEDLALATGGNAVEAPPPENPLDPLKDIIRELRGNAAASPNANVDMYGVTDPLEKEMAEIRAQLGNTTAKAADKAQTLPFGADKWGHDVIKKTIKGAETSIVVGLVAAALATVLGTIFGALSGYFGGWVDDFFNWFYSIFTSVPYLLLILAVAAVLQQKGVMTIVLILALTGWTGTYRLIRAEYLKHKSREYVWAADAIGATDWRKMFNHIFPNVSHVALVQISILVVAFIKSEVILSFLGFGVPVGVVSWGSMLNEAQNELILGKWWQLTAATVAMAVLVTAFSMFTDALRDALDPKLK
ncbi:ABC transporter permease [Noviherbaspirillum galbum]|uniref:ABC transporter permease n=1 Tax=Noviherbaspirillum galbum TaxID=2709383 RepID=A0A6B3SLJ0_9BURK|nr:ABC transporter permease [Noviherbaspirillum galbum]NEX61704.1 ABC transporter permease [Noviherbaspirillum galbum]